jgi:tRNA-uridine 2-sulfurtransferase
MSSIIINSNDVGVATQGDLLDSKLAATLALHSHTNYLPDPKSSKIAVAMSGGVDSSVALFLLKEAGYKVVGITAWIISGSGRCCDNGVVDAVKVCDQLGVEHYALDLRKEFADGIIKEFHESYAQGETPIPCISCNNDIKWGSLLAYSIEKLGATHLASGHYAKIVLDNSQFKLFKPKEIDKDQTYMLWGLNSTQLSCTVYPLADFDKDEVRDIARKANLCVAEKEESQDICFVSNGMTNSEYLTRILGKKPGDIIEIDSGKILGQHQGSFNYTYGQRKGLGIAHSEPLYVVDIDSKTNKVFVGTREKLLQQQALANGLNIISAEYRKLQEFEANVQIRYNSDPSPAKVRILSDTELLVDFYEPVTAITPGQALVMYAKDNPDELIGGAWIQKEKRC